MHNDRIEFEILDRNRHIPLDWKKLTGHMSFDVVMVFMRKTHWVVDGNMTPDPE